jgi:hypothetical protein
MIFGGNCARQYRLKLPGAGDFLMFLADELRKHGAHLKSNEISRTLGGNWKFYPDEFGFWAFLFDLSYDALFADLRARFGTPNQACEKNLQGFPSAYWSGPELNGHLSITKQRRGIKVAWVGRRTA